MRLDKFLAEQKQVSRGKIQKAIKDGLVSVNGKKIIETDFPVTEFDDITLPEFGTDELKPADIQLEVVYENDDVAVINKPAGLVVHPGAGNTEGTLANILISRYPNIKNVGDPHRPGIVHRLDEDTSGLILIAKNQYALDYFKKQFLERKVQKEYLALVHGQMAKSHEMIDLPIQRVPLKQKMKIGLGKPALTEYFVIKAGEIPGLDQMTLIRVKLHTGRTHQIRVHLSHIGHPIVGDQLYGLKKDSEFLDRQFLHAYKLKFQLLDGTWIELGSPLPPELQAVLKEISIPYDDSKF